MNGEQNSRKISARGSKKPNEPLPERRKQRATAVPQMQPKAEHETKAVVPSPSESKVKNSKDPSKGLYVHAICKSYKKRQVLNEVFIHLVQGEAVALLGANGAGKTTCFYIISGLLQPDSGHIFLDGEQITSLSIYQRAEHGLGYLPQEASIFRGLNVEKNIRAVLQMRGIRGQKQNDALEGLLDDFSIEHIRNTSAAALSGGERRRVEIARALAAEPRFILLDEPLAGVDPVAVGEIRNLVVQLKQKGIGVLITDHNVRETLGIVDRAYVLHSGSILHEGSPAEIAANPKVREVYLGEDFTL